MRYFSTFSGIGGFEIGIRAVDASAEFVGYSEIDKYAVSVYEKHFLGVRNYGDITKINAEELPDFDCLVGGFPCQAFSFAGARRGFEDTRGTLFFDLARILQSKRPRLFVFENVKGLLSHDNGKTFRTIIATIDELGYDCQWQVLNSKNHGVPQNRERIIFVGHLRGTPRPEVFPLFGNYAEDFGGKEGQITGTIDTGIAKNHRQSGATYIVNRQGPNLPPFVRRFTPKECERLQAFPDDWTKYGYKIDNSGAVSNIEVVSISDSQRYKMCGNAVTTNVIRDVFKRILG